MYYTCVFLVARPFFRNIFKHHFDKWRTKSKVADWSLKVAIILFSEQGGGYGFIGKNEEKEGDNKGKGKYILQFTLQRKSDRWRHLIVNIQLFSCSDVVCHTNNNQMMSSVGLLWWGQYSRSVVYIYKGLGEVWECSCIAMMSVDHPSVNNILCAFSFWNYSSLVCLIQFRTIFSSASCIFVFSFVSLWLFPCNLRKYMYCKDLTEGTSFVNIC